MDEGSVPKNRAEPHAICVGADAEAPPTPVGAENRMNRIVAQMGHTGCGLIDNFPSLLPELLRKIHILAIGAQGFVVSADLKNRQSAKDIVAAVEEPRIPEGDAAP